jgi:hypothetical protein
MLRPVPLKRLPLDTQSVAPENALLFMAWDVAGNYNGTWASEEGSALI